MFILSAVGGSMLSLVARRNEFESGVSGGASGGLYGLIGVILGYIIINWTGLRLIGNQLRCSVFCSFFMLLILVLAFTPATSNVVRNVNHWAHWGGFITGIWLSAIGTPIIN